MQQYSLHVNVLCNIMMNCSMRGIASGYTVSVYWSFQLKFQNWLAIVV